MTDEELIEFGNKLVAKDRTATEIFNALRNKAEDKDQLDRIHKLIVQPEAKKKERSQERVRVLLAANKLKLKFEYSIRSLIRLAVSVLVTGLIVWFLSSEEMNGNAPFGWITIFQGVSLLALYSMVKFQKTYSFLLIAFIAYVTIFGIEIIVFGIPNDLFEALYQDGVYIRGSRVNSGLALLMGYLFPFMYIVLKILLGALTFTSFWNHKKYDELPEDVRQDLIDF